MSSDHEISLIDLNSSVRDGHTSMPLLPLPRINSPYEGDISSDCNNPFDSVVQDASNLHDPFEFVSKKVQEFTESGKTNQPDNTVTSEKMSVPQDVLIVVKNGEETNDKKYSSGIKNELAEYDNYNENMKINIKSENAEESNTEFGKLEVKSNSKSVKCVDIPSHVKSELNNDFIPEIVCDGDFNKNILETQDRLTENAMKIDKYASEEIAVPRSDICSPEAKSPKFCSTPIQHLRIFKRKHVEETSPISKITESDMANLSPVAMVRARIEKCIARAQESFKSNDKNVLDIFGPKLKCRKSLDSQLSQLSSSPYYKRNLSFQCDQSLSCRYLQECSDPLISVSEIKNTFKSLQKQKPLESIFKPERSSTQPKVPNQMSKKIKMLEEKTMQQDDTSITKLIQKLHDNEKNLEDESIICFVETDEEEDNCEKPDELQVASTQKIAGSGNAGSNSLKIEVNIVEDKSVQGLEKKSANKGFAPMNHLDSKNTKAENSSKSVMNKVLGRMQEFSPKVSTSLNRPRNSADFAGASKSYLKIPKSQVNRSRSDSTLAALQKKERMLESSKYTRKTSNTSTSGAKSMQTKQSQAKNLGKVSKPPKPLSQMFRNKNFRSGKDKMQ